jgi:signal transduction histidine kinase
VTAKSEPQGTRVTGFRVKLFAAIMLVVSAVSLLVLYFAQRRLAASFEEELQRSFQSELAALERAREVRHAILVERCRSLVRRPRIQAAFEDNALDVLYDAARYELQDVITATGLRAQFYRFLDPHGMVITPPPTQTVGALTRDEESRLALRAAPDKPQIGYLAHTEATGGSVSEIFAMPIVSSETGETLAAVVIGFKPFEMGHGPTDAGIRCGIWFDGALHGPELPASAGSGLTAAMARASEAPVRVALDGVPHLLFAKRLNPDSQYPPAFELCAYPLAGLIARERQLRWQVLGAGAVLLLGGLIASNIVAARLSAPVERLAVDSEENRAQRARAEAALELRSAELQRAARFSADASHQLKTPVTVLRAGLEELLANERRTSEECQEISALIHQTYRLSSLIEDLLLLSRMDAGRLKLALSPVNLSELVEASLDDLSALPDELDLSVETDFPAGLYVLGEKRYTAIILQNLFENARKYNRRGGRIRITATADRDWALLRVGNTGRPISPEGQAHIFERFHRGAIGENVPGYGLGLNLAHELARLHQGDLRLLHSDADWTEFETRFRLATPAPPLAPPEPS